MTAFAVPEPISRAEFDALKALIPAPSMLVPTPEGVTGSAGTNMARFSQEGHAHERLTSTTGRLNVSDVSHTIAATGLSPTITFTRPFAAEPGLSITAIMPLAGDILLPPYVSSWVQDAQNRYTGCVIGWKKLVLNNALAVVTVAGISVVAGQNVGTSITLQVLPATGTRFTLVAVARSDGAG